MLQHCHLYSLVHEHHVDTSLLKCLFLAHYAEFPISIHVNVQYSRDNKDDGNLECPYTISDSMVYKNGYV